MGKEVPVFEQGCQDSAAWKRNEFKEIQEAYKATNVMEEMGRV